jgi:hypothetical protein
MSYEPDNDMVGGFLESLFGCNIFSFIILLFVIVPLIIIVITSTGGGCTSALIVPVLALLISYI